MHTDNIGLALNHVDEDNATTDIYLEKDWGLVDLVQNSVLILFRELDLLLSPELEVAILPRRGMYVVSA